MRPLNLEITTNYITFHLFDMNNYDFLWLCKDGSYISVQGKLNMNS